MEAPFKVGQEVVCVRNHSQLVIKKGQQFIVLGLDKCECGKWIVDIGVPVRDYTLCKGCGSLKQAKGVWWMGAHLFAPIQRARTVYVAEYIKEQELILS